MQATKISSSQSSYGGIVSCRDRLWVVMPQANSDLIQMTFQSSPLDGVEYIGRNHLIVERLASFLLEETLTEKPNPTAARCGYVITDRVKVRTNLLLLRLRHLIGDLDAGGSSTPPLMAEECIVSRKPMAVRSRN